MDLLAYALALFFMRSVSLLPHGAALALGRALGSLLLSVVRLRRRVVEANLRHVFGDSRPDAERREIARECYRQFGMSAIEMARMTVLGLERSGVLWKVEERFAADLLAAHRGKASMVVGVPHLGNFDLAAAGSIALGIELHVVMKPVHSERFNRLVVGSRALHGMTLHFTTESIYKRLLTLVSEGKIVAALPDQNAKRKGIAVEFLGKPAHLFPGLAKLHLETGAPLYVGAAIRSREDPRRHEIVGARLTPPAPTGDAAVDAKAVLQTLADGLSALVRRAPEQYFWFHRLWGKGVVVAGDVPGKEY